MLEYRHLSTMAICYADVNLPLIFFFLKEECWTVGIKLIFHLNILIFRCFFFFEYILLSLSSV